LTTQLLNPGKRTLTNSTLPNIDATLQEIMIFIGSLDESNNYSKIIGNDFTNAYFIDTEKVSNKILSLYGEGVFFRIKSLLALKPKPYVLEKEKDR
jgi:hypothetical protein